MKNANDLSGIERYMIDFSTPKQLSPRLEEVLNDIDYDVRIILKTEISKDKLKIAKIIKRMYNNISNKLLAYYCEYIGKSFLINKKDNLIILYQLYFLDPQLFPIYRSLEEFIKKSNIDISFANDSVSEDEMHNFISVLLRIHVGIKWSYNVQYDMSLSESELYKYCVTDHTEFDLSIEHETEKRWIQAMKGSIKDREKLIEDTSLFYYHFQDLELPPDNYRPTLKGMVYGYWNKGESLIRTFGRQGSPIAGTFKQYYMSVTRGVTTINLSGLL